MLICILLKFYVVFVPSDMFTDVNPASIKESNLSRKTKPLVVIPKILEIWFVIVTV